MPPKTTIPRTLQFVFTAIAVCMAWCVPAAAADKTPVTLPLRPAVTPDGDRIAFSWRGDLWQVGREGGTATRLTTHPADDNDPRFSPDGKTLYFTSLRDGPRHLFSMPADGGQIKRHSHHSEGLRLETIRPDGAYAVVRALRDIPGSAGRRLFDIPLGDDAGGESMIVDVDFHGVAMHPEDGRLLGCRSGESPYRKGYRGSRSSSIWLVDPDEPAFESMVAEEIPARSPLWHPSGGSFYYLSERDGTWNIWIRCLAEGSCRQLTRFEDDGVLEMAMSADGRFMVLTRGFGFLVMDPEEDSGPREIDVFAHRERTEPDAEVRPVRRTGDADFSASGLEIVFEAEGRLFAMDTVLRDPNQLTDGPVRHESPRFTSDGKSVIAIEESGTHRRLVRIRRGDDMEFWWRNRGFEQETLAGDDVPVHAFKLIPERDEVAFVDVSGRLLVMPVEASGPPVLVHQSWTAFDFDPSPDGEWMAVATRDDTYNRDIWIVRTDGSVPPYNLSRHPGSMWSPRWSPDGRMIAFIGQRRRDTPRIHLAHLSLADHHRTRREARLIEAKQAMKRDPWYQDDDEEASGESTDPENSDPPEGALDENGDVAGEEPEEGESITIDFEELHQRVITLDSGDGTPTRLVWAADSESLLFQTRGSSDEVTHRIAPRDDAQRERHGGYAGIPVRMDDGDTSYWIIDGAPAKVRRSDVERYPFSIEIPRDRREHLALGFEIAWRTIRDRFYDPALNGLDWDGIRLKYLPHAKAAANSSEFSLVVRRMFGELNSSHLGVRTNRWPEVATNAVSRFERTRHTGLRFETDEEGWPRVVEVIPGSPAALAEPPIEPGARLLEVDGRAVVPHGCHARLFNGPSGDEVSLTLEGTGDDDGGQTYRLRPITYREARELGRAGEIRRTRRHVETQSDGKLGYIRIARMDQSSFETFQHEVFAAGHGRDGLIIDIRDNSGGFIADHLLTILSQPRHSFTVSRNGGIGHAGERTVYTTWHKPVTILINERSVSNAEVFAHAIQSTGRGKVVGVPTHGAVISTTRTPLLDIGTLNIPFRGWFHPETGVDLELGPAVPDVMVENTPGDLAAGIDAKLDAAIEVLLAEAREHASRPRVEPVYRSELDAQ